MVLVVVVLVLLWARAIQHGTSSKARNVGEQFTSGVARDGRAAAGRAGAVFGRVGCILKHG